MGQEAREKGSETKREAAGVGIHENGKGATSNEYKEGVCVNAGGAVEREKKGSEIDGFELCKMVGKRTMHGRMTLRSDEWVHRHIQ